MYNMDRARHEIQDATGLIGPVIIDRIYKYIIAFQKENNKSFYWTKKNYWILVDKLSTL